MMKQRWHLKLTESAWLAAEYVLAVEQRNEYLADARACLSPDLARASIRSARIAQRRVIDFKRKATVAGAFKQTMRFEDYDRERRISETGAFGRVPYNPPAGSLE